MAPGPAATNRHSLRRLPLNSGEHRSGPTYLPARAERS